MLSSFVDRFLNFLNRNGRNRPSRRRGRALAYRFNRALRLEPLEERRLLTALSIPTDLTGSANDVIQVPVNVQTTGTAGIDFTTASFAFSFDSNSLSASNVRVTETLIDGWGVATKIDNIDGTIVVSASGSAVHLAEGTVGNLLLVDFQVKPDASPGTSAINLLEADATTGLRTGLNEGAVTLDPAPTDDDADSGVDGAILLRPSAPCRPISRSWKTLGRKAYTASSPAP